jgi:hypothetical protein
LVKAHVWEFFRHSLDYLRKSTRNLSHVFQFPHGDMNLSFQMISGLVWRRSTTRVLVPFACVVTSKEIMTLTNELEGIEKEAVLVYREFVYQHMA